MTNRNRSGSSSMTPTIPCRIIIDFFSRWLEHFPREEVELILGQMIYGLINNTMMQQYGLLVKYFIDTDDSECSAPLLKLKHVDEIFEECYRNLTSLDKTLSVYRGHMIHVSDVVYDKVAGNVCFLITNEREMRAAGWVSGIPGVYRERCPHGRPLVRRR